MSSSRTKVNITVLVVKWVRNIPNTQPIVQPYAAYRVDAVISGPVILYCYIHGGGVEAPPYSSRAVSCASHSEGLRNAKTRR